jgi:uncharacterized protein DUF6665
LAVSIKEQRLAAVNAEIARERAQSLSRSSLRLRTTLESLRRFDSGAEAGKPRSQWVTEASEACLAYLVQREIMGFGAQDAEAIRREYGVPRDVWNAMGALPRT